jgi:hypothetical protein
MPAMDSRGKNTSRCEALEETEPPPPPLRRSAKDRAIKDCSSFTTTMVARESKIRDRSIQIEREGREIYCRGCGSAAALRLRLRPPKHRAEQLDGHKPPGASPSPPWPDPLGHKAILHMGKVARSTPKTNPIYSGAHLRPANPAEEASERPGQLRSTLKPCSWMREGEGGNECPDCIRDPL